MQLTKKTKLWGASGVVEKPNDVKIEEGWTGVPAEQPPARWFNWVLFTDETNINDLIDSNNSFDTELSTVITAGGITPDLSPSGPGNQLLTALQTGELIPNDGISGVSLDKFEDGTWSIVDGNSDQVVLFTSGWLQFQSNNTASDKPFVYMQPNEIRMGNNSTEPGTQDDGTNIYIDGLTQRHNDLVTNYTGQGIRQNSGPGDGSTKSVYQRTTGFNLSSVTWTEVVTDFAYRATPNYNTDLSLEFVSLVRAHGAFIKWDTGTGDTRVETVCPAKIKTDVNTAGNGNIRITEILVCTGDASSPPSSFELVLDFNGLSQGL